MIKGSKVLREVDL
jgi:hypothetical protein